MSTTKIYFANYNKKYNSDTFRVKHTKMMLKHRHNHYSFNVIPFKRHNQIRRRQR